MDNRRKNLREVTNSQNAQNRKSFNTNNKTGIRNVSYDKKRDLYVVQLCFNKKRYYFGRYKCKFKAEKIAINKRKELGFLTKKDRG